MPKNKKPEKDGRMIADYFNTLNDYYKKYGEKTILLWQCGGFFEIYCVEDPETGERLLSRFDEYLEITHMNKAKKNLTYSSLIFYNNTQTNYHLMMKNIQREQLL